MRLYVRLLLLSMVTLIVSGCASPPPNNQSNICSIFRQYPDWYEDAVNMQQKWGAPINVAMAIMQQESSYRHDALPPKDYALGFIPWGRVSSAYGYAQALDPTWAEFEKDTGYGGSRSNFNDAIQFIGWYIHGTQRQLGLSKWNTYGQYLAYHEGRAGYRRGTYRRKPWLMKVARKVEQQSRNYGWQLQQCRKELNANESWW